MVIVAFDYKKIWTKLCITVPTYRKIYPTILGIYHEEV